MGEKCLRRDRVRVPIGLLMKGGGEEDDGRWRWPVMVVMRGRWAGGAGAFERRERRLSLER
jgi:hypothetical protein